MGGFGFLLVILSLSGESPLPIFATLLVSWHLIISVLSLYIDDRHTGQLHLPSQVASTANKNFCSQRDKFLLLLMQPFLLFVILWFPWDISWVCKNPFLSHPCRSLTMVLPQTRIYRLSPFYRLKRTSFFLSLSPLCRPPNWSFFPSKSLLGNAFL